VKWLWRSRTPPAGSNVEAALRDQEQKAAQEKNEIKGLMANAKSDRRKAEGKLQQARSVSRETERVAEAIKKEEEKNGLAHLFRRGIGGMT
jgi:cob(I)alamin adenosyltransferase